jgi:hypothetical protein
VLVDIWSSVAQFAASPDISSTASVELTLRELQRFRSLQELEDLYSYAWRNETSHLTCATCQTWCCVSVGGSDRHVLIYSTGLCTCGTSLLVRISDSSLGKRQLVRVYSSQTPFGTVEAAHPSQEGGDVSSDRTWLILPVVICLSQRLSHACLSISLRMAKLRMAH